MKVNVDIMEFFLKKIIKLSLIVFCVLSFTFLVMNFIPGGPFMTDVGVSNEIKEKIEEKYGLNQPIGKKMLTWYQDLIKGDLGVSYKIQKNEEVLVIIKNFLPVSMKIGVISLVFSITLGLFFGCISAFNNKIDAFLNVLTSIGITIPSFIIATILLIIFGATLKLLPTLGLETWKHYILPCLSQSIYPICYITKLVRNSMIDISKSDYITTARSFGYSREKIIYKYMLKNSLISVVSYLGSISVNIMMGSFAIETIFNISGLGRCFVKSIIGLDYPLIMGITLVFLIFTITLNFFTDFLQHLVDPRIRSIK